MERDSGCGHTSRGWSNRKLWSNRKTHESPLWSINGASDVTQDQSKLSGCAIKSTYLLRLIIDSIIKRLFYCYCSVNDAGGPAVCGRRNSMAILLFLRKSTITLCGNYRKSLNKVVTNWCRSFNLFSCVRLYRRTNVTLTSSSVDVGRRPIFRTPINKHGSDAMAAHASDRQLFYYKRVSSNAFGLWWLLSNLVFSRWLLCSSC